MFIYAILIFVGFGGIAFILNKIFFNKKPISKIAAIFLSIPVAVISAPLLIMAKEIAVQNALQSVGVASTTYVSSNPSSSLASALACAYIFYGILNKKEKNNSDNS